MNIWLISAFEPTPLDHSRPMRFMGLADALLVRGHQIIFVTSTFAHGSKQQRFAENTVKEIDGGRYRLVYLHSAPYKKNIGPGRLLAHMDFAKALEAFLNAGEQKPDLLFISLPPLSTVDRVCRWGKMRGVPVVVDIIDPWPDVFLKSLSTPQKKIARLALFPFYRKLKRIFNNASAITAISSEYAAWAASFSKSTKPSGVFYPAVPFQAVQERLNNMPVKPEGPVTVIYAGSLGSSYDLPCILEAAEMLHERRPGASHFLVAGTGPQEALVKEKLASLPNVSYLGWLGADEIYRAYRSADLGLAQHVKGATQSVTYKLFDYLSAGLPVLNSLESEMKVILDENSAGLFNEPGNAAGLAANICRYLDEPELLGIHKANALELTARLGDSSKVYDQLAGFLERFA